MANQGYDIFLAPANVVSFGGWDDDAVAQDLILKNPNLDSLVEVEWDSGFFAPEKDSQISQQAADLLDKLSQRYKQ